MIRLQVLCKTGGFGTNWRIALDVRNKLAWPAICNNKSGPYVKLRWVEVKK